MNAGHDFVHPDLLESHNIIEDFSNMTYDNLEEIIVTKRHKNVRTFAPCRRHRHQAATCSCGMASSLHVAGTPCPAFSTVPGQRKSKRRKADHETLAWLLWVALMLLVGHKCIVHENVEGFDVRLLERYFSEWYIIETLVLDLNCQEGFPLERRRRYTFLMKKSVYHARASGIKEFTGWSEKLLSMFTRQMQDDLTFMVFFGFAPASELVEEKRWAANRPSSLCFKKPVTEATTFDQVLTQTEVDWRDEYAVQVQNSIVLLSQNSFNMPMVAPKSKHGQVMQTIVRNCPQLYVQNQCRWFCPTELFQAHTQCLPLNLDSF